MINRSLDAKKAGSKVRTFLPIVMVVLAISLAIPGIVRASSDEDNRRNMFYIRIVNYALPIVKNTAFDEDDMVEDQFSLKENILNVLGINTSNPMSILGTELAFLKEDGLEPGGQKESIAEAIINPFKLTDSQVSKDQNNSGQTPGTANQDDLNLPDNKVDLYNPGLKKNLNEAKPDVFIYHTHTEESYSPGPSNTMDQTKNVCAVGDVISNELEKNYGVSTVHDKTVHDVVYNNSYARSAETVDKYMKKYGDFKLVIDLHRDSVDNKKTETIKLNGVNTAKIMLVMSKSNPHFAKNDAVANKIIEISNRLYPGLCKKTVYYNHGIKNFNQSFSNNAILIEVGSNVNTTDEAKNTGKYLARIIAEFLNGKN